jgi:hypothetical protein
VKSVSTKIERETLTIQDVSAWTGECYFPERTMVVIQFL